MACAGRRVRLRSRSRLWMRSSCRTSHPHAVSHNRRGSGKRARWPPRADRLAEVLKASLVVLAPRQCPKGTLAVKVEPDDDEPDDECGADRRQEGEDIMERTMTDTREPKIITEALAVIDKGLAEMLHRELVSTDEVADLLLDVRTLLATPENATEPLVT